MSGNGDCFLSVRASPSARSTEIDRLTEGASTTAVCQVVGESVRSSVLGRATNVWVRDAKGRYMSAAFLDGDGWNPQEVTTPCP